VVRKITAKVPSCRVAVSYESKANRRHRRRRRFKEIYQTSCFSKTIVMNMMPPGYPGIDIRTDMSNSIFVQIVMNMMPPDYPGIYIGTDISNRIFVQIGGTLQNFVC